MAKPVPVGQLVAIGASAGGIEALSTLMATLPHEFPAPIVIAQHLDPTRPSQLGTVLARHTSLPVRTVHDREALEAGVVYVVPANRHIRITDHYISTDTDGAERPKPSIDLLFQTAAEVFGEDLIAVVLSGLGSDGAAGARRVKDAGGTVVIQNPRTASYPAMPQALAPTTVDVSVDVDAMGSLLYDLLTGAYTPSGPREDRQLRALLAEVRERSGIEFNQYKVPTIQRRLQRRLMATNTRTLREYRAYLERHPDEHDRLVNSFLIKVTGFFRDPDLFTHLRDEILPSLVEYGRARNRELRLWSAGCATGEEAYSLAVLVAEVLGSELDSWTVRIFATDLDGEAVEFGRRGVYAASALEALPAELVARYFVNHDSMYEVRKQVRSLAVFGQHDLGQRPPFPRIDLCLCRNVLIYFIPELQRRALELFAFALRPEGYLVLGKTETTSPLRTRFAPVQPALRIFQRQGERFILPRAAQQEQAQPLRREHVLAISPRALELARVRREAQAAKAAHSEAEELLLLLPFGVVVVNDHYDIVRINTAARRLLGIHVQALGEDVLHLMVGLPALEVRAAIDVALRGESRTLAGVPTHAIEVGSTHYLQITCLPWRAGQETRRAVLVIVDGTAEFVAAQEAQARAERAEAGLERLNALIAQSRDMNRELLAANESLTVQNLHLRSVNEDYVLDSEDMQAATEEVETLNEELQATNEELETLNEEQQATVEELETTNDELRARSLDAEMLARTAQSQRQRLEAILGSMSEAVMVLDSEGHQLFSNAVGSQLFFGESGSFTPLDDAGQPLPPNENPLERAKRGDACEISFSVISSDGKRRWYEATGRPIRDSAAAVRGSVVVARDITDRTLRALQDEFLALVSHELRTPLTSIIGYLELLLRDIIPGPKAAAQLDRGRLEHFGTRALRELRRLHRLINDLLDVSRMQNGQFRVERDRLDLAEVVAQAVEVARMLAPEREILLDREPSAVPALGDAARLEQVVLNLITNALMYASQSRVEVRVRRSAETAELQVQDYGPGIPEPVRAQLFERFFQVSPGNHRRASGMGLGLYITQQIVEAHGGSVSVESQVGKGATFTVRLPLLSEGAGG